MLKLRGNVWQWSETIDGTRHRLSTGESTKAKAIIKVREYLNAIKLGDKPLSVGIIKKQDDLGLTLKVAFDRAFRNDWKKLPSYQTYEINSRHSMRILGEDKLLDEINQKSLNMLKDTLFDEEYSAGTINRILTTLSSLYTLVYTTWDDIEDKPRRPYFTFEKEDNRRMRLISPDEEIKLLQAAPNQEIADLITHLSDTGCRLGEALRLTPQDIDLREGLIKLWKTKNGEARGVPLTDRLKALWERRRCQQFALTKDAAEYWFNKTKELAGITDEEVVMHSFRHTCATALLESGVPIDKVQYWMGHKSITTTQRYAKMTRIQLDDACRKFQSRSTKGTTLKVIG